jgi:hypothetical protein
LKGEKKENDKLGKEQAARFIGLIRKIKHEPNGKSITQYDHTIQGDFNLYGHSDQKRKLLYSRFQILEVSFQSFNPGFGFLWNIAQFPRLFSLIL